jgi:hypothetical protein
MSSEVMFTYHAARRMPQRAIARDAVDLLLNFGRASRVRGATTFFFDKYAREQIAELFEVGAQRRVEKFMNVYAVIGDDGLVITAARRMRRLHRD